MARAVTASMTVNKTAAIMSSWGLKFDIVVRSGVTRPARATVLADTTGSPSTCPSPARTLDNHAHSSTARTACGKPFRWVIGRVRFRWF